MKEKKFISIDLREKWIQMVGFRNILVYDYLEVDRKIVYEVLQTRLGDIEELKQTFATFL